MTSPGREQYNVERFGSIFADISRYIRDLEELHIERREDLNDKRNFYAVSMIFFSLLNRVIDLGSEMVIARDLGVPSKYRDIFIILEKNEVIDSSLAQEMLGMVTFRNLLSHEYHGIDEEKLFRLMQKIGGIRTFVETIRKEIQSQQ